MEATPESGPAAAIRPERPASAAEVFPAATEESARVDFKRGFDAGSLRDWCEVIKDLVAMANSGGGLILFGLNDDGTPFGADLSALGRLDPATVTDKHAKYISQQFSGFREWRRTLDT